MLVKNLVAFCHRNAKYETKFKPFLKLKELNQNETDTIVETLCNLLMDPWSTLDVAECFPQLLLLLLSKAIPENDSELSTSIDAEKIHRLNCVVLGKLIRTHPDVLGFVLRYFEINPAPFEFMIINPATAAKRYKSSKLSQAISEVSDHDVVVACHNMLQVATDHFKQKWNWSKFYKYLTYEEENVRWVALKCIAIVLDMSESLVHNCAKSLVSNLNEFMIEHDAKHANIILSETENLTEEVDNIVKDSTSVVSVAGVLLPVLNSGVQDKFCNLVPVPSMEENLRSLALAVASRKCICLQGPVGCGKTALVEYLAKITGHSLSNFAKVQLGDQTDSKMLLGTYRCTDTPGEFVWQPGVLTQAVMSGKWLLLEDIDSAALDVASVLSNLIETGTLSVPGYRDTIHVKSGFQLFLTQRLISTTTGLHKQSSGASNLLEKNWLQMNVEPLSKNELVTIIQTLFPVLSTAATRIVDVFLLFSMGNHGRDINAGESLAMKTGRLTSTRDLMKWCNRAIVDFEVSSPDSALRIFQDAIDIFCCSVPDQELRLNLATTIGHTLGIVKMKAEYFCNRHKPPINYSPEYLIAGRAKVFRKKSTIARLELTGTNFSFTRPSTCLLERIASCVAQKEPVLLVGETGTGKTSSVQFLARSTGHKLVVINMNQQSESADLLGGYKPVDIKFMITPIREEFEMLFRAYFAIEPNKKFLEHVALCYKQSKWKTLVTLMSHSTAAAIRRLRNKIDEEQKMGRSENGNSKPESGSKRYRSTSSEKNQDAEGDNSKADAKSNAEMLRKWKRLALKLEKLESQVKAQFSLAFAFIEGSLIKALQQGHWVLLDEINLANAETLECLSGLLEGSSGSLSLLERGDKESIKRHPDFTLFACMNPATDIGKKELPVGLRNRFTELYVDELTEQTDLQLLVGSYLGEVNLPMARQEAIVKFYLNVRKEAVNSLMDGTAHKPHYSLRTLCRALNVAASNPCGAVLRSLYEAFCLSFLTQLDHASYPVVQKMIVKAILDNKEVKAVLSAPIPMPSCGSDEEYINFEGYWVVRGSLEPEIPENYILTESVRRNLKDLVRVVSIGKMPVLLQGDTSVGKTSLITYLARASGHLCVRINNHEHTDLQEYVGSYVADENGKLVFREGVLVEAMRKGHWIILDELNLAPSDVLEALNRVLDDNRELFIPETQQTVKAHDNFMLFATQNPPGLYGGRKVLSRAFRNRFVELHFDEIPAGELQIILHQRCSMPDSYCKQIINVMTDLQIRRKSTAAFAGKQGFITLRDLFRWGERYRLAPDVGNKLYDWSQHLADEGYLVLAAKVRKPEEAEEIRQVIKKHLRRDVDPGTLFTLNDKTSPVTRFILEKVLDKGAKLFQHVVWTYHMRRLAVLVGKSCQFKEPILLVGETGGGKTTICQLIAATSEQKLYTVNCHMHTESSDFLGSLRPVRDHSDTENQKLFEWVDGPLIKAMQNGDLFLADEISLADDSVLERLNSLLEPERSLLLAEKGVDSVSGKEADSVIVADGNFLFIGTMNPGGDYGKKELSPALRNRFTEVWCEGCTQRDDLQAIIEHNLFPNLGVDRKIIGSAMLDFVDWLTASEIGKRFIVSIRDILTWVNFINYCSAEESNVRKLDVADAYFHGACLTYIDSLGSGLTGMESSGKLKEIRDVCLEYLNSQIEHKFGSKLSIDGSLKNDNVTAEDNAEMFGISPFFISKGPNAIDGDETFTFTAPTTKSNTLKLLRGLQLSKPLLLEGSPGVGKTSLVSALAKASGQHILRINLSDQTDVSDLFGADLPVEGGRGGEFAWRDGPFLQALRAGHWILLDELNLASQSVLEGLNACLDHRGEVYVPELGRTFTVKSGTKLFACQNPLRQGGARRGLPKSFLNRFTQVTIDTLSDDDLNFIATAQFPEIPGHLITKMVQFNSKLASEAGLTWGYRGSPWEMNLRDITRWCEATMNAASEHVGAKSVIYNPGKLVELIYVDRMRSIEDKQKIRDIYQEMFSIDEYPLSPSRPIAHVTEEKLYLGDVAITRSDTSIRHDSNLLLLRHQMSTLKSLAQCVNMNWMAILVGDSGCGKSSVVRVLAQLAGRKLKSIAVNSAMDTTEILGGFEQTDYNRHLEQMLERVEDLFIGNLKNRMNEENLDKVIRDYSSFETVQNFIRNENESTTMSAETELFLSKVLKLSQLVVAMKEWDKPHAAELENIHSKLKKLYVFVGEDKCLNAGGKFEWVDSVLVKCLQEGSWLLVDQVNLCSPAVLDRLNGLLEPGGVLSIGERGVDCQGNIVTIKPHKDFRLFLTMDPRYGEISRAMRNRGIEIYMLGDKENSDYNQIDLKSMLFNSGLTKDNHQEALLQIHQQISEHQLTTEKLSVIQLLHSAFLISQQISRGFPAVQAFRTACTDVYVKSRAMNYSQTKETLAHVINETIDQFDLTQDIESYFDLDAATWSILNLQENSKMSRIRQQGSLLIAAIEKCKSTWKSPAENYSNSKAKTNFINELLDLSMDDESVLNIDIVEILPHLLLSFYQMSSQDDTELRSMWLSKYFEGKEYWVELQNKNAEIGNAILAFKFNASMKNLPWDLRQLPEVSENVSKEQNLKDANRLVLILYLLAMNSTDGKILAKLTIPKDEKVISVMQYSNSVYHGELTSHLQNQPLITNFVTFIAQLDKCIDLILRDDSITINTAECVDLRLNLKWRSRFYDLGKLALINKLEKSKKKYTNLDEVVLLLTVHYKWLMKVVRNLLESCAKFELENNCKSEINVLSSMMANINESLSTVHDPFRKISKKIKNYLNLPLPRSSETDVNTYTELKKLSRMFLTWEDRDVSQLKHDLKIISLQTAEALDMRCKLINFWHNVYSRETCDEPVLQNISEVEQFCEDNHLGLRTPVEVAEVVTKVQSIPEKEMIVKSTETQLWPIYEYIFLMLSSMLQSKVCLKMIKNTVDTSRNTCLFSEFATIPSIPINLLALLNVTMVKIDHPEEMSKLLPELYLRFTRFTQNSCAVRAPGKMLHWTGLKEEDLEDTILVNEAAEVDYPIYGPVLVNLVSELVLDKSTNSKDSSVISTATLGTYRARLHQLKVLNDTLWRNSVSLNSNQYNYTLNDVATLESYLNIYLSATEKMEAEHSMCKMIQAKIEMEVGDRRTDLKTELEDHYLQPYRELCSAAEQLNNKNSDVDVLEIGKTWALLGYIQVFLFGNLGYIDPVHKVGLKLRYIEEDIADFKNTLYVAELQSRILGDSILGNNTHPRIVETAICLEKLHSERNSLKSCNAVRPEPAEFVVLARETASFRNTLGSSTVVQKHINKLTNIAKKLNENPTTENVKIAQDAVREEQMWQESLRRFSENTEIRFMAGYPDIVLPLLAAVAQLKHGVRILADNVRRLVSLATTSYGPNTIEPLMCSLVRFPTIGQSQDNLLKVVESCTAQSTRELINKNLNRGNSLISKQEQFRMIKCGLSELFNHMVLEGSLSKSLWMELNDLLQQVVLTWQQQQKEQKEREAEKESLYKNKMQTKGGSLTEDEEIAFELRKLFPTHHDTDFSDLESVDPSLEKKTVSLETEDSYSGLVSEKDIENIREIHSIIVKSFTSSEWLKKDSYTSRPDYIGPLVQRYKTFGLLLEAVTPSLDRDLTSKLYNSLSLLVAVTLSISQGESLESDSCFINPNKKQTKSYDFYKDSNVEEVKQCLPILERISDKAAQLLQEWPEHPSLKSIRNIVQRIYSFPVTSSVSRFLTGLELLLVKLQEWEQNAHSGVSLSEYSLILSQQIISWRRLELTCWKVCLNVAFERLRSQASKWWFFLYALIESYVTKTLPDDDDMQSELDVVSDKKEPVTPKKLIESLQLFMNNSTLAEYSARLDLVHTFHCHVYNLNPSCERDELLAILWNIHKYYDQFTSDVNARIKAAKVPIEKKLKDFVKIARWNDISYWAVKETVEKTHRTLHKYIREFESKLKESVLPCLLLKPTDYNVEANKGIWDQTKTRDTSINPMDFVAPASSSICKDEMSSTKSDLISRAGPLFTKARKLSKETILMSSYPSLRVSIEQLIQEFIEHSSHLKSLEIDKNQLKPKQKSQAKSILQQKKMALADYFKTLTRIGVSYRTGVLTWKNRQGEIIDLTTPPLNVNAAMENLKMTKVDKQMLDQWEDCDKYYYKSLVKIDALNGALMSNQTDLGLQNMERCRGFSTHLMLMAHNQKRTLTEAFNCFLSLRLQLVNFSNIDERSANIPNQRDLQKCAENLKQLLIILIVGLEQVRLYINTCPTNPEFGSDVNHEILSLDESDIALVNARKGDAVWEKTNSAVRECLDTVYSTKERLDKSVSNVQIIFKSNGEYCTQTLLGTSGHYNCIARSYETLEKVAMTIHDLKKDFADGNGCGNPIVDSIDWLEKQIENDVKEFEELKKVSDGSNRNCELQSDTLLENFKANVEHLVSTVLIAVQTKYKKNLVRDEELPEIDENEDDEKDDGQEELEENTMSEKLVGALKSDINELALNDIATQLNHLSAMIFEVDANTAVQCNRILTRCLPLLEQYLLLAQFYLNEQVATFRVTCKMLYLQLNVFLDLAINGFCVPKNLDLEEDEGGETQESSDKGGMGLGDGEGEKDVSDRIETEDQLDEARPQGEEKENKDDKDCKEEDKGIDMSEDFDSKLQDVEKRDDDEEKQDDSEDDDLDKQMGDTEKGADELDEEIWGDDKDEPEEDEQEKEEGVGKGEQFGEKEMGAKDDQNEGENEEDKADGEQEKREELKEEINEMNEPETNDDQVDPYHGQHQPEPEPEPLDLPEDMNLDGDDAKDDNLEGDENPFDIDTMKETMPPAEKEEEEEAEDKNKPEDPVEDSSDEEGKDLKEANEDLKDDEKMEDDTPESDKQSKQSPEENEEKEEEPTKEDGNEEEKAQPSTDDSSKQADATDQVDLNKGGSLDKVAQKPENEEQQEAVEENSQDDSNDKGTGQAQSEEQETGHSGSSMQNSVPVPNKQIEQTQIEKRKNPGKSDEDRSLVDKDEPNKKKLKMIHTEDERPQDNEEEGAEEAEDGETEMYQHIKNSDKFDKHAVDAATEEQVKQQASNVEDEKEVEEKENEMDVDMNQNEDEEIINEDVMKQESEKMTQKNKEDKSDTGRKGDNTEEGQVEMNVEVEGETTETSRVKRGDISTFHTNLKELDDKSLTPTQVERKRFEVETMLGQWMHVPPTEEAIAAWNCLSAVTDIPARDLSEKLRLVLEPTQASRLKGDYKTGRRINMRKVIPYIASQFRKDKIWLRRTKPSKRDYQIVLALDDSSSMADNHSKELAFESLSLISKAMTYLEVGQLCVISFGENTKVLHPLGEPFTEQSGSRLMQEMRFEQKKTMVGQLVDCTVDMFENQVGSTDNAKLLVVLSDGRGVFSDGADRVNRAVRRAKMSNIFLVFIIVDNPVNKDSILDIRMPIFQAGKLLGIRSYMDNFPFPFYMILRDINALPAVLSDALRQWFEVVGKTET